MVAPALAAAYLVSAPTTLHGRLRHVGVAAVAFVVSAGWFVVLTLLWPASSRPYIAGSTDNNFMNLVLGYNGFARVLGRNHVEFAPPQSVVGEAAGEQLNLGRQGGFGGFGNQSQGWSRLFGGEFGFEIGWLIPAALLATVLVVFSRGRAPRTDLVRAAALLFGGWLVVDGSVLSFMHGSIHPYYCLSIAPPMAAMFAIAVHELWRTAKSGCTGQVWPCCWAAPAFGVGRSSSGTPTGCPACGGPSWCWLSWRRSRYWHRGRRGPAVGWHSARSAWDWSAHWQDPPRMRSSQPANRTKAADRPSVRRRRRVTTTSDSGRCRTTPS